MFAAFQQQQQQSKGNAAGQNPAMPMP